MGGVVGGRGGGRAAALGQVEFWTLKPWRSPDEDFLSVIGEALRAWRAAHCRGSRSCAWSASSGPRGRTRSAISWPQ